MKFAGPLKSVRAGFNCIYSVLMQPLYHAHLQAIIQSPIKNNARYKWILFSSLWIDMGRRG